MHVRSRTESALYASGFLWAWGYFTHFARHAGSTGNLHWVWAGFAEMPYLVAILVTYFAAIVLFERKGDRAILPASWAGCFAMMAGTLIVIASGSAVDSTGIVAVGSALTGLGVGACSVAWGLCLSKNDMDALERTVLSWCPLFAIIFLSLAGLNAGSSLSDGILVGLLVALPLCSQIGLNQTLKTSASNPTGAQPVSSFADAESRHRLRREDLGAYVLSLVFLCCAFLSLSFMWIAFCSLRSVDFDAIMLLFSLGTAALFLILRISLRVTKRFGLATLFRWALPFAVLAMALAASGGELPLHVSYALLAAVYFGFDIFSKLYFVYEAHRIPQHAAAIFGLGLIVINVGGLLGNLLWNTFEPWFAQEEFSAMMLFALVPFVASIIIVVGHDPLLSSRNDSAAAQAPTPDDSHDALSKRCEQLGKTHGLTPREIEVVTLLAQGRSRSYIRETLYISKGTVDTHAYHAYAKLGIKNRDDLMNLADPNS